MNWYINHKFSSLPLDWWKDYCSHIKRAVASYFRPSVGEGQSQLSLLIPTTQSGPGGDYGIECNFRKDDMQKYVWSHANIVAKYGWVIRFTITSKNYSYPVTIRSAVTSDERLYTQYEIDRMWNEIDQQDDSQATWIVDGKPSEPKPSAVSKVDSVAEEENIWNTTPYQLLNAIRQKIAADSGPAGPGGGGKPPRTGPRIGPRRSGSPVDVPQEENQFAAV